MRVLFDTRVGANVRLLVEGSPEIDENVHSSILAVRCPHLSSFFQPARRSEPKEGSVEGSAGGQGELGDEGEEQAAAPEGEDDRTGQQREEEESTNH